MKNIYFAGAISSNNYKNHDYYKILNEIKKYGKIINLENYFEERGEITSDEIFEKMEYYLDQSNVLIAEISIPSHGVGIEIAYAQYVKKIPILCLYKSDITPSPVLQGNLEIDTLPYENEKDIEQILKAYFEGLFMEQTQ